MSDNGLAGNEEGGRTEDSAADQAAAAEPGPPRARKWVKRVIGVLLDIVSS